MTFVIDLCQINSTPGDINGNLEKIITHYKVSKADLIIFPELSLTGYNCKDLFLDKDFLLSAEKKLQILQSQVGNNFLLIGMPRLRNGKVYNSALLLHEGKILLEYDKYYLPHYGLFDERRYFEPGIRHSVDFKLKNKIFRLLICEDLWYAPDHKLQPADAIIVINASPFSCNKLQDRLKVCQPWIEKNYLIYVNACGGQDHLVFDGGSFVMQDKNHFLVEPQLWEEQTITLNLEAPLTQGQQHILCHEENLYQAIMLGLYDYCRLNNFSHLVLGLSGGIDSALTATIALDVFGDDKVTVLAMPSEYSTIDSIQDAQLLAKNLNLNLLEISIQQLKDEYLKLVSHALKLNNLTDITTQNIQPRIRATLLMAVANQNKALLLSTSNKSESAVGYTTIYGDMAGGFAPIVDLYKSQVYKLAQWRNQNIPYKYNAAFHISHKLNIIPQNIIIKEPSAELKYNQKDSDTLPAYELLDEILQFLIENKTIETSIITEKLILKVESLLFKSEFKRQQAPVGPKVSDMMLSLDRQYPISVKK